MGVWQANAQSRDRTQSQYASFLACRPSCHADPDAAGQGKEALRDILTVSVQRSAAQRGQYIGQIVPVQPQICRQVFAIHGQCDIPPCPQANLLDLRLPGCPCRQRIGQSRRQRRRESVGQGRGQGSR